MNRSDLMKFWKLLAEAGFTGSPSKLNTDEVRKIAKAKGLLEHEIEAVLRGFLEFPKQQV